MAIHILSSSHAVGLEHGHSHRGTVRSCTHGRSAESTDLRGKPRGGKEAKSRGHMGLVIHRCRGWLHDGWGVDGSQDRTKLREVLVAVALLGHAQETWRRAGEKIGLGAGSTKRNQVVDVGQRNVEAEDDVLPIHNLLGYLLRDAATRWGRGRRILEDNVGPSLEDLVGNMQLPINSEQERNLILVDLLSVEAGDLAPGTSRVVAVLKILGGQDECGEEHATPTLESTVGMVIVGLLHGEIVLGNMGLDEDQIIQCYLEGGVAGTGASQGLLNESSEGEHGFAAKLTAAYHGREGPNRLDDMGR